MCMNALGKVYDVHERVMSISITWVICLGMDEAASRHFRDVPIGLMETGNLRNDAMRRMTVLRLYRTGLVSCALYGHPTMGTDPSDLQPASTVRPTEALEENLFEHTGGGRNVAQRD